MRALAIAILTVLIAPSGSFANGRFPASVSVAFDPADNGTILLGATFGLLMSTDGGETFHWSCEDSIGYGGTFDPKFAVGPDGTYYATTFTGLRQSTDSGCTWSTVPLDGLDASSWAEDLHVASNGSVWVATATTALPNDILVRRTGQASFATANLKTPTGWWKTVVAAPSQPTRVYATGYEVNGKMGKVPVVHLRRTDDEGLTWIELETSDFTLGDEPQLFVEAVSPADSSLVFARVAGTGSPVGDTLYRSLDAGESWTEVLTTKDFVSGVVARADGSVIVATVNDGVRVSASAGAPGTFVAQPDPPRLACVAESSGGTLYGCAANYEPDNFALGTSPDGATWTKVTGFEELAGPLSCASGTPQVDVCIAKVWPGVCAQLGVCGGPVADAGLPPGEPRPTPTDGCGCRATTAQAMGSLLALVGLVLLFVRRRRGR